MLTCIPQSICSWDFRILGGSNSPNLTFDFFTEQGGISIGATAFTVRKHGWLSGHWSLERGTETFADARKPSAMFRSFEILSDKKLLTLKAQSAFTRSYVIVSSGAVIGTIQPAHAFTRRAFIDCDSSVSELVQLFSFWLVVLTWRRAARDNNNAT